MKGTNVAGFSGNKRDESLAKVKEQLNQALATRRSHEQGNLLPNVRNFYFYEMDSLDLRSLDL